MLRHKRGNSPPLYPVCRDGGGLGRASVDPGADDTVLPLDLAELLAVSVYPAAGHSLRWRAKRYSLRYGDVALELVDDDGLVLAWAAVVASTTATSKPVAERK
jgi:hypothetical protein